MGVCPQRLVGPADGLGAVDLFKAPDDEVAARHVLVMADEDRVDERPAGRATAGTGHIRKKLIETLPYSLTHSQTRAVGEIVADLAKPERMLRLLQGDVGSGKTVVALLAAAGVLWLSGLIWLVQTTQYHWFGVVQMIGAIALFVRLRSTRLRIE